MPTIATAILLLISIALSGARPGYAQTLHSAAAKRYIIMGTAVTSDHLREADYSHIVGSEFSQVQAENEMKFARVHPAPDTYAFAGADAIVSFASAHGMLMRGHTLVWHRQVPTWVSAGPFSPSQLRDILQSHITTVMRHYVGQVYAWDVVNEAFNDDGTMRDTIWYDRPGIGFVGLGTAYIEKAFAWAHAADPKAKLFYNDYDAEPINAKSDAIYAMAQDFKIRGVPLDGIGFQAHITLAFDNPETLGSFAANLRRFANLGLELHITELDIRLLKATPDALQAQAKLYGEIAKICVQQPACKVLQTWGFTDKYSWIPRAFPGMDSGLLWDAEYRKKPAYFSLLRAME